MSGCGQGQVEDDDENMPLPVEPPSNCIRCNQPALISLRAATSYCQSCFADAFLTKVKKGLEPARRRGRAVNAAVGGTRNAGEGEAQTNAEPVDNRPSGIIAFSGSTSSRALVELVKRNFVDSVPKKKSEKYTPMAYFKSIEVLWIDESGVPGFTAKHTEKDIRAMVEPFGFAVVVVPLSDIFTLSTTAESPSALSVSLTPSLSSTSSSALSPSPQEALAALFTSSPSSSSKSPSFSATSRTSLHSSLLTSLIRLTVQRRSSQILFTSETATSLSIRILSGVSLGRGFSLGEETAHEFSLSSSGEEDGLMVVRPLGLCLDKEVRFYAERVKGWEGLGKEKRTLEGKLGKREEEVRGKKGIQELCQDFILGLEDAFPGTVSTVIRTAGKLGMRTNDATEKGVESTGCPLCGLPAQPGADEWRKAITVSSFPTSSPSPSDNVADSSSSSTTIPLASLLCYGCLLFYEGSIQNSSAATSAIVLPGYVGEAARSRFAKAGEWGGHGNVMKGEGVIGVKEVTGVDGLKKEIEEFLL